jgi:hypothetical protein
MLFNIKGMKFGSVLVIIEELLELINSRIKDILEAKLGFKLQIVLTGYGL